MSATGREFQFAATRTVLGGVFVAAMVVIHSIAGEGQVQK